MTTFSWRLLGALLLLVVAPAASAPLQLFPYFASGAVLQREAPIPVWGQAGAGAEVTVTLAGTSATVTADAAGRWRAALPARAAGGPFAMTIASGAQTRTLTDLYVGDVWVASGQSNMEWRLDQADGGIAEANAANDPQLRQFKVPKGLANEPSNTLPAGAAWASATTPAATRAFSAVAYYAARGLRAELGIPIGILNTSYGGSRIETWMSEDMLGYDEGDVTLGNGEPERQPTVAWNKMVHPLLGLPFKGVLWYQGESNADNLDDALAYGDLFQTMITGWRADFGQGDLPFVWVQLPNFGALQTVAEGTPPTYNAWPELRAGQSRALALPNTGEVISIDTGNPDASGSVDIHPTNKEPVGERMALVLREVAYGEDIVASGPRYASNQLLDDGSVAVSYTGLGSGLANADGTLNGFTISGANGTFVWANAEIDGDRVIVSSPSVSTPAMVRYAWQYNPGNLGVPGAADLTNAEGLPAAPFEAAVNPGFSIAQFSAARTTIEAGQNTVLSWRVFDAATVTLDGAPVALEGSQSVSPEATTTYTLTAVSASGETLTASVTLEVIDPSLINRARSQPATASTVEACCGDPREAAFAVDDDLTTRWASAWSDGVGDNPEDPNYDGTPDDEWLAVDLGGPIDIDRVILTWEASFGTVYELQTSFDGYNWTTVYREDAGDGEVDDITFSAPVTGSHLRMQGIDRTTIAGQQFGYSLFDIAVYGEVSAIVPPTAAASPRTGNVVTAGEATTLVADVSGSVQTATFYVDGVELATDDAAPFIASWTPEASGVAEVTVEVVDASGITVRSAPAVVFVDDGSLVRFEAEDATVEGGSDGNGHTPLTSSSAASGGEYLDLREQWAITLPPVTVDEAGTYLLSIGYQMTYESPKTQNLIVNGVTTPIVFTAPDNSTWMQRGLEVQLNAGENAISLVGSWNYMSVDFLAVGAATPPTSGENAPSTGSLMLDAPRPNPARGATTIHYSIPEADHVRLDLLDVQGRRVAVLVDANQPSGEHSLPVSTSSLAVGVYVLHLTAGRAAQSRRMTVVR
ncbi:sialate O-acetylesterase [Rubricoccus marinus]|nr:sialate O-acetylesterase [Rubricoccus marinus]